MRTRTATAVLTAGLLAGLTACSSTASTDAKITVPAAAPTQPTSSAPSTAAPEPAASQAPAPAGTTAAAPTGSGGLPPTPDTITQTRYIAALTAIDPEIVDGKPDRAVSRGRSQCSSVAQYPRDQTKLVELTGKRFTSAGHPEGFGDVKSTAILAAVRAHICPNF
ncbi:hypothetical protein [Kitasatospora sp. NPDC002965]|uniref:hypothetical protein n=1 Tax=Kitasatospora sp. NPDC002965 TaxID=3154775 RepID=UPI0033ACEA0C